MSKSLREAMGKACIASQMCHVGSGDLEEAFLAYAEKVSSLFPVHIDGLKERIKKMGEEAHYQFSTKVMELLVREFLISEEKMSKELASLVAKDRETFMEITYKYYEPEL